MLAFLITAGLLLGGSSAGGVWANAALQLLSLVALALVLLRGEPLRLPRGLLALAGCVVMLPLLQLIPLPPTLWAALPGRAEIAVGFDLAGVVRPWLPVSLDQDATLSVMTTLIPPLAVLAVAAQASARGLGLALRMVVAVALGSVLLGLLQRLQADGTAFYPYELTNRGAAVGLFANRNHLATLLLVALPCAVAVLPRMAGMAAAAVLAGGTLLTGSDAGALLLLPVLGACLLYVRSMWHLTRTGAITLGGVALLAVAAGGWFALQPLDEPTAGGAEQHRPAMIATTLHAARDFLPLGSGGGSFQRIYPRYEDPARADPEYRNHAHNDYAEVALEYGLPGVLVMLGAIVWWGRAALSGLASPSARAGAVMLGAILLHSLVDYPLRTSAIATLAAMAAVLLARADETEARPLREERDGLRISL